MKTHLNHQYSPLEEKLNIYTHGFALFLSVVAFPFLLMKSIDKESVLYLISFLVYGFSLIILFSASTFYHAAKEPKLRRRLNIIDHASIYILIAGTYTPFSLLVLKGNTGWLIFGLSWIFALIGIILKLFFTGKYDKLSTAMYLFMGWQIMFVIKPLVANLSSEGLKYLIFGGVFYTIGAILYSLKKLPYNHAIFHVFVIFGALCHFISVYFFV